MLKELADHRERLIYAYALLRGVHTEDNRSDALIADAMAIINDVVQNAWITAKSKEAKQYE